jgi:Rieske Fe-S protein
VSDFDRRTLLLLAGSVAGAAQGCAILSGGAAHPEYKLASASPEHIAKIPLLELQKMKSGETLLVKIADPELEILLVAEEGGNYRAAGAECTHWGCTVDFNASKKEWECACHGSRFASDGKVLEGPAEEALPLAETRVDGDYLLVDYSRLI